MNIRQIITVGIAGIAMGAMALDNVEVTDVTARQRYPWNGKVDIDFTLDSKPTEPYLMDVTVFDNVGKTNLAVKSVCTEGISWDENPTMVRDDTRRIVWDASKDLPNGFRCTNVLVSCQDSRINDSQKRYMIVDLSAGSSALSWPVTYTNRPPEGGWTEEYKTTKLVLRRIEPGKVKMGSAVTEVDHAVNEDLHEVTLSKAYYIGVYKLTAKQYSLVSGNAGGDTKPASLTWKQIRGYDVINGWSSTVSTGTASYDGNYDNIDLNITITQKQGSNDYSWPLNTNVETDSLVGMLRSKTLISFDLPTEAQWERACRAGSHMPLNIGVTNSVLNAALITGPAKPAEEGTYYIYVGNYLPNAFGLYDMTGMSGEWCLDIYVAHLGTSDVDDPIGASYTTESVVVHDKKDLGSSMRAGYYDSRDCKAMLKTTQLFQYTWQDFTHGRKYHTYLSYNARGVRRVVRGENVRAAYRSSSVSINDSGDCFTDGINLYNGTSCVITGKATYANPTFTVRLVVNVEE